MIKIKLKKLFAALILFLFIIMSSSCSGAAPLTSNEEIKLHRWNIYSETDDISGFLTINKNELTLDAELSGEKISLNGESFIDDNRITVLSDEYGTVVFEYKLIDDKLTLVFYNKKLTFIKG